MIGGRKIFRRGFTLIELLVVVATIALLIAILLPALSRAKEQAKRSACLSNLKQLGIGIQNYANDDKDYTIPFGPKAPPMMSPSDFYPVTGSPTSLISLKNTGNPVGLGLMLTNHISKTPKVLFCPGSDQQWSADAELAKVGVGQAQSSYFYRHGSVATNLPAVADAEAPHNIRLVDLGYNRNNKRVQALAIDTQLVVDPSIAVFNVFPRTHHQKQYANVLFSDGHAVTEPNANNAYTANLTSAAALLNSFDLILKVLENADDNP